MQASAARLASVTRRTAETDPIAFFTAASDEPTRALWLRPHRGDALVGIGSACTLTGTGAERFRQIASVSGELGAPLLIGGFSFDPGRESTELWDGFPDARMVLPERLLTIRNGAAWLTTNVVNEPERLTAHRAPRKAARGASPHEWQQLVATIERGIRTGELGVRKVVLASSREVHPTRSLDETLRALAQQYPRCTIFALARGKACFVGATPERLIALKDHTATTMALAGSAPRGGTAHEDALIAQALLGDPKERDEHAIVVDSLRESLMQVCSGVVVDASPRVHKLENVQHLITAVRGQVERGQSVLDLVEHLHPTPAVGGFPRSRALELIRQHEALDRGWYAAPIGWMDQHGQGEFVVGLRAALVRGDSATLFAGCGIVAGSDPATEYMEWGWKLRPMLSALGVNE
jgi:isochorismate synthase